MHCPRKTHILDHQSILWHCNQCVKSSSFENEISACLILLHIMKYCGHLEKFFPTHPILIMQRKMFWKAHPRICFNFYKKLSSLATVCPSKFYCRSVNGSGRQSLKDANQLTLCMWGIPNGRCQVAVSNLQC